MRRKPFLRTRLDVVMEKLLMCGSVFKPQEADNLAYATALLLARNMVRGKSFESAPMASSFCFRGALRVDSLNQTSDFFDLLLHDRL